MQDNAGAVRSGSWRDRSLVSAIDDQHPMTAFIDSAGEFWAPRIRDVTIARGQAWTPYEDFMDVAALLEAALRRERELEWALRDVVAARFAKPDVLRRAMNAAERLLGIGAPA